MSFPRPERREMHGDLCTHVFERSAAVDHAKTTRIVVRARQVCVTHALEKSTCLALELVERAPFRLRAVEARTRDESGHVEQQREIGLAIAVDPLLELANPPAVNAVPAPLISIGRVSKAIAKHPVAARERRTDHAIEMLAPRREHQ